MNPEALQKGVIIGMGGFIGAYTTFSTFEYETGSLLRSGEMVLAALNVILSVLAGFGALKLGEILAKIL